MKRDKERSLSEIEKVLERFNDKKETELPHPRFRCQIEYDFLKYIRVAMKWAVETYELTRPEIELIIYFASIGVFSKEEFNKYHKIVGMYQQKTLNKLIEEGWIQVWRISNKKLNHSTLYHISLKGTRMSSTIHKICAGLQTVSLKPSKNKLAASPKKRINKYYLDLIKDMNNDLV